MAGQIKTKTIGLLLLCVITITTPLSANKSENQDGFAFQLVQKMEKHILNQLENCEIFPSSYPSMETSAMNGTLTFSTRINHGNDDAEEQTSNGSMDLSSSDLELGEDGSTPQWIGMRFTNVTIPSGVTITNAYVEFEVDETDSESTSVTFWGEDVDDAVTFSNSGYNITSRTKTSASVDWNNIPAWSSTNELKQTPDLSTIIQEIVNRNGWSSGNDLVIMANGTGERTAESENGEAALRLCSL